MQFTILRETPVNSGSFIASGEVLNTTSDGAIQHALDLAATNGTRFAVQPYDPLSRPAASARLSGPPVVYSGGDASAIVTGGVAVQIFLTGSVINGADIRNTSNVTLWIDMTGAVAVAGSATAVPIYPGESYHFPLPPQSGVSGVAASPISFVPIRY